MAVFVGGPEATVKLDFTWKEGRPWEVPNRAVLSSDIFF